MLVAFPHPSPNGNCSPLATGLSGKHSASTSAFLPQVPTGVNARVALPACAGLEYAV